MRRLEKVGVKKQMDSIAIWTWDRGQTLSAGVRRGLVLITCLLPICPRSASW